MCSAHKKVECKYKEEQKQPPVIQLAAVFMFLRSVLILLYLNAGRIRLFPSISEITKICTFGDRLCPDELHLHHVCKNIVHAAQVFCQFKAAFIPTEITDTAGMIVVAKFKIILRSSLNDINDPVIFISA